MALRSGGWRTSLSPFGAGRLSIDTPYSIGALDESTSAPDPGTPPPVIPPTGGDGPIDNPVIPIVGPTPATKPTPTAKPKAVVAKVAAPAAPKKPAKKVVPKAKARPARRPVVVKKPAPKPPPKPVAKKPTATKRAGGVTIR